MKYTITFKNGHKYVINLPIFYAVGIFLSILWFGEYGIFRWLKHHSLIVSTINR